MTVLAYIGLALLIGLGSAVQVSMVASLGRLRGAPEAAWINVVAAVLSLAVLFAIGALRANPPNLPAPFTNSSPSGPSPFSRLPPSSCPCAA
jgi:hypothetical protein